MNTKPFDAIAKAVLYEGYMLYPYRPSSVKNRQRFNFGVLYPESYAEESGSDVAACRRSGLWRGMPKAPRGKSSIFSAGRSFVAQAARRCLPAEETLGFRSVGLEVDGKRFVPWQEAIEREVSMPPCKPEALCAPLEWRFAFSRQRGNRNFARRARQDCGMDCSPPGGGAGVC